MDQDRSRKALIEEALPWARTILNEEDPLKLLSELQAANVIMTALRRAAGKYDSNRGPWRPLASDWVRQDISEALLAHNYRHPVEVYADIVFGS